MGGAFWEFGQPDWDRTKLFVLFGVAEDHDSQPDQDGHRQDEGATAARSWASTRSARATTPWPTNGSASPPAPTGCLILSIIHELFRSGKVDLDYLRRYTNAGFLVNEAEGAGKGSVPARQGRKAAGRRPEDRQARGLRQARRRSPTSAATHEGCAHRLPPDGREVSLRRLRARGRGRALRPDRRAHPQHRRRVRPRRLRGGNQPRRRAGPTGRARSTTR